MEMCSRRKDGLLKKNSNKVVEELDPEEVLVLEEKEKKIAIFGDGRRKVHRYSAV
jgi:predicted nucleotide-binding protein (sugar kinase/HSP70/actin superfamily)